MLSNPRATPPPDIRPTRVPGETDPARSGGAGPLVSVIVPAYDAEATLAATLDSVCAQTHARLEILVVDDGSRDATADIAQAAAARDPRITLLTRDNGGVARARNTALARAQGAYVAWIDADDLWHPAKIERQLAVFAAAPDPLAFVYTGYRRIDPADRILPNHRPLSDLSGRTFYQQIAGNFFSNISSIMAPAALVRHLGGHDPRLRDEGIEGAEDLLLQLRLVARGPVGCCRQALVGYRQHAANMSLDRLRAARTNLRALDLLDADVPGIPGWVRRAGRARVLGYAAHCLADRRPGEAAWLAATLLRGQPVETVAAGWQLAGHLARRARSGIGYPDPEIGRLFAEADPASVDWHPMMLMSRDLRARLARADAARAPAPAPATASGLPRTLPASSPHPSPRPSPRPGLSDMPRRNA